LAAAGFKLEDLDKLDLYDRDGLIEGPRELRALYDFLKTLEGGGPAETLTVKSRGWSAARVDHAFDAFDSRFEASPAPRTAPVVDAAARARLPLTGSVGAGATNRSADVKLIQQRLKDVGFDLGVDGQFGGKTKHALETYRAMLTGTEVTKEEPGLVEPGDLVDFALSREAPPRWEKMPRSGTGFVNEDLDHFGFGSGEAKATIEEVGAAYARDYLATKPQAALISLNDVSQRDGGHNRDHQSHQNGLDLDLRLPRTDGTSGSDVRWANYDREAAWAMLTAIASNPRVERVLFSDADLLARARSTNQPWASKVFDGGPVHRNHFHVDVKPPKVGP
jgi:peptidoglycan hydrolase-like protein with peptidoglycan-binding domain